MTFKELLTRFEEMEWSDNILFVEELRDSKLYIDELQYHKIDYNQGLRRDKYDGSFIITIDDKDFTITKKITEDDII